MKIKILFDKDKIDENLSCGWGISYLVDERILFDTGEKSEYLFNNIEKLKVDIERIEKVIISHNSWDHRGGLWDLLKKNKKIQVFACLDFFQEFKDEISGYDFKLVKNSCAIDKDIYTSGCLETTYKDEALQEQFLLVRTDKGINIVCGCAHSGLFEFIDKAKNICPGEKINSILGGMHLIDKDKRFINYLVQELKTRGVRSVGPSHCTGFDAANVLKEVYGDNFLEIKAGAEFDI